MGALTVGSLFSGYGGLELGIERALGARPVWNAEIMPAANRVLAARRPDLPNLGDVSRVDWSAVKRPDVIAAGFPCQDVSGSGLRRGIAPGTRSGLWSEVVRAIDALRPELVIVENVRGLTSAPAARPLESDEITLGDGEVRPALRALGAVLGDLADLGFDAEWIGLRASDVGAPHHRFRIFLAAFPQDADGEPRKRFRLAPSGTQEAGRARADAGGRGRAHDPGPRAGSALAGEPPVSGPADAERLERERRRGRGELARPAGADPGEGDQRERHGDAALDRGADPRDWGAYAAAVGRWERRLGRVAPDPTANGRLSPEFVEWMMGLPVGWVTDPGLELSRAEQLRLLGNGVVPQQAEQAIRLLLARGR